MTLKNVKCDIQTWFFLLIQMQGKCIPFIIQEICYLYKVKKYYTLFIFLFTINFAFAQPSNINTALLLPSGNFGSDYFFDSTSNQMWFSFIADKDRMTFSVMHSAGYSPSQNIEIDSIALYQKPGSKMNLIASARSPSKTSDSLPAIQVLHLIPGNRYYLKLTKFNNNSSGYFNLSKIVLHPSITPSPCTPCALGANLICNGDFENLPAWASGNCYTDSSLTFSDNPPLPASIGYCISSPNMRNEVCNFGNGEDYTDVYVISNSMYSSQFQNSAEHGSYFMGVDCPSSTCFPCRLAYTPGYIWTPGYRAIAWQQNVSVSNGNQYQFSCWLEDLDNEYYHYLPGATVYIVINADTIFSNVISNGNGYGSWKQVEFCWAANSSTAKIQIIGEGAYSFYGYDFGLDNISFISATNINETNTITNVPCAGGNLGAASIGVSGGVAPYTYSWAPGGGTNATETGLSAGTYTVTINDFSGCVGADIITITQPPELRVSAAAIANISCNGGDNGVASSSVSGGTLPYTYSWAPVVGNNSIVSGLIAGTFTITVNDACGATATASTVITQPPPIVVSTSVTMNDLCIGGSTGSVISSASGGTVPYTYLWAPMGGSNSTAINLNAGTYTLTVHDKNGCTGTAFATITQPNSLTVSAITTTNVSCNGGNNGSALCSASGGTAAYTYLWTPWGGTANSAIGLSEGTYTITVNDACGATATSMVTITQPNALSVYANTIVGVICMGSNNGSATSTVNGGTAPYNYLWSGGGGTNSATSGLHVGTYTLTVNDDNGCTATTSVTINQPDTLHVSIAPVNVSCNGERNGSATSHVSGGALPYTYSWSNSATTANVTNLGTRTYTLTVQDSCGNMAIATVTITQPTALSIVSHTIPDVGNCLGSAWVDASGGTPGYNYSWIPGGNTTDSIHNRCPGSYCCTVTDAHGCVDSVCITITSTAGVDNILSASGEINVYPNPNNGQFTVVLSEGTSTGSSIEIYNVLGQDIKSEKLKTNSTVINLSNQANGVYLYRVLEENGNLVGSGKLIIQK